MNSWSNLLLRLRMVLARRRRWEPFIRQTQDPAAAQQEVLQAILQRNRDTRFGREHGFAEIRTPADFVARVTIQHYEDLRPYIEQQEQQKTPELLADQPIMYARTSGTTGQPKYIPILADTVARYKESQQIFSCCHYAAIPGIFDGKTLAFVSPAFEGRLPTGTPYGSMSGLIYQSMPKFLREKYLIPAAVFDVTDHELKYLLIAAFALAEPGITYMGGANPSTYLKIAEVIRARADILVAAVETGELPGRDKLGATIYRGLQTAFRPHSDRAQQLRKILAQPEFTFVQLWPGLKAVSCWREGSGRVLLPAVQRRLGVAVPILEMGYLSSECRGSLPVDSLRQLQVPTIHENFFEFVERDDWESGQRQTRTVDQLETGRAYYVIITTPAGLYRYFMNDIVMVDGFFQRTPTIKFLEKGTGATNITGEKLYESQVSEAVEALLQDRAASLAFFVLVADPEHQRYRFYVEAPASDTSGWVEKLDEEIGARNLEYKGKRESGRLHPIELKRLRPGTGDAYRAQLVAQGQREAQFKFVRLQNRAKLAFDLDAHLAPTP